RGVEGQHARVQERAAPVGVQAAAVLVRALILLPVALGEIQIGPVTGRLIRLDTRAANLPGEPAADRPSIITYHLGVEPESTLTRKQIVVRVALPQLLGKCG